MRARKKVIQGGTSAGKTYGIIPVLIDSAAKIPRLKITVVAETVPAVRDGALDIFRNVMIDTGRFVESRLRGSQYTFANGSVIQFKSFPTIGKAKAAGKRDILFLNEGNHIPFAIADALMIRSKEIWIDYNPDNEFWAHTEVLTEDNSEYLLLTYKDNEALPEETLEDLKSKMKKAKTSAYWKNWCRVYIEGKIGKLEGQIFTEWKQVDTVPEDAKLIARAIDFGFTNDPTTLVEMYKYNGLPLFHELIYETGLTNGDIARRMKQLGVKRNDIVYADSSEPKSIKEINNHGFTVKGATKGADSVNFGISILQEDPFYITSTSLNLINELRRYAWDRDKLGNLLNKPIDLFNHLIDAMRYIAIIHLGKGKRKQKIKRRN